MTRIAMYLALSAAALSSSTWAGDLQAAPNQRIAQAPLPTHAPENAAERACTKALAKQLGGDVRASDLWIISTTMSEGALWVTVHVPSAEEPWACVFDSGMQLIRTQYMGEG